jgi:hypothetical protein
MRVREEDVRYLNIVVAAQVDGGVVHEKRASIQVPPAYDAMDVRALVVRKIEDTTFGLLREDFGREPTKAALLAYVARQRGIQEALDETMTLAELRIRLREIIETGNDEARAAWGELTE